MTKLFLAAGALNAFLAVALGAFGAHALSARLSMRMLDVYKTGVQYHMAHALALILIALLADRFGNSSLIRWSGNLILIGIVFFSGSLYVLAISGVGILGAVTPLGGLCFLTGWALLFFAALKEIK